MRSAATIRGQLPGSKSDIHTRDENRQLVRNQKELSGFDRGHWLEVIVVDDELADGR
jgi:hypothetical protein